MNWNIYFQAFTVRTWRKRLSNLNTFLTPHIYWGIHITICVNYNQHREHIVSRDELMTELWNNEEYLNDNALTVNISRLRGRFKDIGLEDVIETRKGQGYILV